MKTVLIVDDDDRIRRGLSKCIKWDTLGIDVIKTAENGKEALDCIVQHHPNLVLTDISMPIMTGLELIKTVQDLKINCNFVILSGHEEFEYAKQALKLHVLDYLVKPVNEDEVYALVKRVLSSDTDSNEVTVSQSNDNLIVHSAIKYIEKNYAKHISLQKIAEHLCIHPNYFSSLFSLQTKQNFTKYLIAFRINKAKELLKNPRLKVYEVADLVGYSDYKNFTKYFKSIEGISPGEFRNKSLNFDTKY